MSSRAPESADPAQVLRQLFADSVQALDTGLLVAEELRLRPMASESVTVLALGKSALPMARAALEVLGPRVHETCVVAPSIPEGMGPTWLASSHPHPSELSVEAANALLAAARRADGEVLFLLSGGGSALAALPAEGLSLAEKSGLVAKVYAAGAAIGELNLLRKHLSAFKGGGLAAAARVPTTTLLVSDVIGDVLHTVSSGPTLVDTSTREDALAIALRYLGNEADGPAIRFLRKPSERAIPSQDYIARGDQHRLLAGMAALASEAHAIASKAGLSAHLRSSEMHGDIQSLASEFLRWSEGAGLWIAAAEASVQVVDKPGRGGRAHQLALLLAREIQGDLPTYVLVAGTDGIDGNSEAAGALVDHESWQRLAELGVDAEHSLRRCDAATALQALGAQIVTGETGVNHADLLLLYRPILA